MSYSALSRSNKSIWTQNQWKSGSRTMKSNLIILITRNQLDTCHIRFILFVALQNVLRVANDGFSSLIHCNVSNVLYIHIYLYFYRYIHIDHCTILRFFFVWVFKQKAISLWMSCIDWTQSSIRHWEEGTASALPVTSPVQSSPVVSSLQIIMPCPPRRIWPRAQSPRSRPFVDV